MLNLFSYKFAFEKNEDLPSSEMTFSAFPGTLSSTEDWYLTNNNLLVTETTLGKIDIKRYSHTKKAKDYIPNFLRVLSATRFARNGKEWCQSLSTYNSGTYSAQWMIINYNKFKKIKGTKKKIKGLVYLLEQTPDRMVYHDISYYIHKVNNH